jgi:hypothetical protein
VTHFSRVGGLGIYTVTLSIRIGNIEKFN